ncbi:hypothetical protein H1R20_g2593, partial [Candolleomyces eurysporus]
MSDVSCRIVVISSSLDNGALLVNSITALDKNPNGPTLSPVPPEPVFHPWSISNRYYTANVHFALHTVNKVYGAVFEGVPAVIVAWTKGEPFEEYMETVQKAIEEHTPEVLLAVRLPKGDEPQPDQAAKNDSEESEDNGAIDAKLITYGFEYVDASEPFDASSSTETEQQDDAPTGDEGIPHLPRVIDALSTIMWPSMTSTKVEAQGYPDDPRVALRTQSTLEAIIDRDPLAILQALQELDSEFNFGEDELDGEDAELFKEAYQSHLSDSDSNWTQSPSDRSLDLGEGFDFQTASPTEFNFADLDTNDDAFALWSQFGPGSTTAGEKKPKVSLRFEDDFTVFVSAPVDDVKVVDEDFSHLHLESPLDDRATPDYKMLQSADQSLFPHGEGSLYRSLGSTSDLGDPGSST